MVKFNFVIEEMPTTYLTRVIITSNYSHLNFKWDVSSTTSKFSGFRFFLCNENYGANVAKYSALHLGHFFRNFLRIIVRIELINPLLKHSATVVIQRFFAS